MYSYDKNYNQFIGKLFISVLTFSSLFLNYVFASVEPTCNTFSDILQTRDNPSRIDTDSGTTSYIYNSSDCSLNTGDVYKDDYGHGLQCEDGTFATASGTYGTILNIDYSFNVDTSDVSSSPASGFMMMQPEDETIDKEDEILSSSDYDTIDQDYNLYDFSLSFSGDKSINYFSSILNTVTFKNLDNHDLSIGTFETGSYGTTNIIFDGTADNIYIYELKNSGSNILNITNFQTEESIKMHDFELGSSSANNITLRSPKVVIDSLNSTNDNNTIIIYADEIDIGTINLAQNNQLIIHPYTEGNNVIFHSNSITSSSSSTIILDSGEYYTNSFSIPGSSDVSSIKASNSGEIIDFYINGDFAPGNNPGINSDGNSGNFGTLPSKNFRMFINGDLDTGGGGTTFNSLIYVEGKSTLGSPTYIRGALSSGGDIEIKNDSKFYGDDSMDGSGWDECENSGGDYTFQNDYSCGIMPTVLTSYEGITTQQNDIYNTCTISVKDYSLTEDSQQPVVCYEDATSGTLCSCDSSVSECSTNNTCTIIPEPKNRLDYTVYETTMTDTNTINSDMTFTEKEYGSYTFTQHGADIRFEPDETYSDDDTKLMLLGDFEFSDNDQTLTFDGGDYYFNSFKIDRDETNGNINQVNICAKDDIRIFVKNDFIYSGNHLNDAGCSGKIFIYVEGDAEIDANGGGSSTVPIFIYTKGDVSIENSGDSNDWYGAITAEGTIDITGKNINFIYDDGASDFGYGECQICYSDIIVSGQSINFMNCGGISMMSDIKVPIYSTDTLDNVTVDEVHDETLFSFSFMSTNNVIDENGTVVADATETSSGWDNGAMGMDVSLFGGKAITYPLGSNYGPADEENGYYQLHSSSLFSMDFSPCDWVNSLNYVAHYEDSEGRHYDIELSPCNPTSIASAVVYTTGPFDAWDTSGSVNDRNISTKIVNLDFNLTIASMDITDSFTEVKNGIDMQYQLYDMDTNSSITTWEDYNATAGADGAYATKEFKDINQSHKNTRVRFRFCTCKENSGVVLKNLNYCETNNDTNCDINTSTYSSDAFAIRPDRFQILNLPVVVKAGKDFNLTIRALDNNGNKTAGYAETLHLTTISPYIDYNETKTGCKKGILSNSGTLNFTNGEANITLKYSEVGDLNISIKENNDTSSFASVDREDTELASLLISEANATISAIPDHFEVNASFRDFGNNFTYISNDLNMSAILDINITAQAENNSTTVNYNSSCYAKNSDYNITYTYTSITPNTLSKLNYFETNSSSNGSVNISDKTINISTVPNSIFSTDINGTARLTMLMNFDRNNSKIVEPFTFTIKEINATDVNGTKGYTDLNSSATFYYGRVHAPDYRGVSPINATIYYEVYCKDCNKTKYNISADKESIDSVYWYVNILHTGLQFGAVDNANPNPSFVPDGNTSVTPSSTSTSISGGIETIELKNAAPYKDRIKMYASPWLIYNLTNSTATTNDFLVEFFKTEIKWAGKGKQGKTVDLDVSAIQNRRLDW